MRSLRSVNLNLMPVLRELLRKRNVTHAAQTLNLSQPAVSEALARLRNLFNDELLVPEGRQLRLTSRAERIQQTIENALAEIEGVVLDEPPDIATVEGIVKIATADYVVHAFGLRLIERVAEMAPRLTIHFVSINPDSGHDLSRGAIDFILTPSMGLVGAFERAFLFDDRAVCIVPKGSNYGARLSEQEFWSARHAAFAPSDVLGASFHSTVLQTFGRHEFNAVIVQNFLLLPLIIESANAIAILPKRLADSDFVRARARVAELPFDFPRLRISAAWHNSRNGDPVHRWLREQMIDLSEAETSGPAEPTTVSA